MCARFDQFRSVGAKLSHRLYSVYYTTKNSFAERLRFSRSLGARFAEIEVTRRNRNVRLIRRDLDIGLEAAAEDVE